MVMEKLREKVTLSICFTRIRLGTNHKWNKTGKRPWRLLKCCFIGIFSKFSKPTQHHKLEALVFLKIKTSFSETSENLIGFWSRNNIAFTIVPIGIIEMDRVIFRKTSRSQRFHSAGAQWGDNLHPRVFRNQAS